MLPKVRFVTYLDPGLPHELYEEVARYVAEAMPCVTTLDLVTSSEDGGPTWTDSGGSDSFAAGTHDVGFITTPEYFHLCDLTPPPIELLAAPVLLDGRAAGRPVYHSGLVVASDHPARSFGELRGSSWALTPRGLTGYYNVLKRLLEAREDASFIGSIRVTDMHREAMELVADGAVDAAAVASSVLALEMRLRPEVREKVRILEWWGPYPVHPLVVRAGLDPELKARLRQALLSMHLERPGIAAYGLERFSPIAAQAYEAERIHLARCAALDRGLSQRFGDNPAEGGL